jgi:DNA-binding CsgD family transcriptional regulator
LPATTNPETTPANWTQKGFEIFAKILHPEEQAHFRHLLSEYLRLYFVAEPKNRANLKLTTTLRLCGSAPNGLEEEWVTLTFAAYPAQENGRQPNFWICQMKPVPVGPLRDFIRGCIVLQKADGGKPTLLFQTQGRKHFKLSPTEKRVLQMLACGLNTQEAAELLGVKENTVKTHRKSMLSKSGALNMPHLITYCLSYGLL